jgi:hypothetical protein
MPTIYKLFLDESCHLHNDKASVMCIGYVKVSTNRYEEVKNALIKLKLEHRSPFEIKWNKFSASRLPLYKSLIDFFYEKPIDFRCVLVKYKERLDHQEFNGGSPTNFYYKLIYYLLRNNPQGEEYHVFLDISDTRGKQRLNKIHEVFNNLHHGVSPFTHFQHLRSDENVLFQITDFLVGAITYKCRKIKGEVTENKNKDELIEYLEFKSGYSLHESTELWENKFNIFDFQPRIK